MNCKPGDLAIVVGAPGYEGRLVEVLFAAPDCQFLLPNGQRHARPSEQPSWVVNILGTPIECAFDSQIKKPVLQGACADRFLRPLSGKLEDEEIEDERAVAL